MAAQLITGNCRQVLRTLPSESVHCVVTSPPYWGLRDYGTAMWEGGDTECDHVEKNNRNDGSRNGVDGFAGSRNLEGHADMGKRQWRDQCPKCGARRIDRQIGLESTPHEYVASMVEVFCEVRRILRKDGTVWLNLGDSYATGAGSGRSMGGKVFGKQNKVIDIGAYPGCQPNRMPINGLKPKDLIGIPWRVAFALQANGWYLRQDIVWSKPNPMPETPS